MTTQNRTFQRRILAEAQRDGYADLYWFIEMRLPGNRSAPAAYPGRLIPVVPVAPDPEQTRHWAHLLAELFASTNPAVIQFTPALTHVESLTVTGAAWYVYGNLDVVCPSCGAVNVRYCCDEAMKAMCE